MENKNKLHMGHLKFHCVAGHAIDHVALDAETEMCELDAGAQVRLCRRHGTPLAVTAMPWSLSPSEDNVS